MRNFSSPEFKLTCWGNDEMEQIIGNEPNGTFLDVVTFLCYPPSEKGHVISSYYIIVSCALSTSYDIKCWGKNVQDSLFSQEKVSFITSQRVICGIVKN